MSPLRSLPVFSRLLAVTILAGCRLASAAPAGIDVETQSDRLVVRIDGELLTELRFGDGPKPYFYPLLGPGGVPVTRNYPMRKDATDEEQDHPHHRSLWFTHGDVNGIDFWAEGPNRGRIVLQKVVETKSGKDSAVIRTENQWVGPDRKPVLSDETTFRVLRHPDGRVFDYSITLAASEGVDVVFGDTKEGTFGLRLAESMRLKANKHYTGKPTGHIAQDTGLRDGETWGKRAKWCAYWGPVGDKTMGVVVFDHPSNPRYPTWWHVRDYGLFAANPFGVHDFEKKEKGAGNLTVKAGDKITFRYRVLIHAGDAAPAHFSRLATEFAKTTAP